MIPTPIADLGDAAQWLVGIGTVLFIIQYTLYAKWWNNFIGRSVILLDVCLLAILGPSLATLADPGAQFYLTAWYAYLETGALVLAAYTVISRMWGWERLRRARGFNGHAPRHPSDK